MPRTCAICDHSDVRFIDSDLAAGCSIPSVSLKHFGNFTMVEALERHERSHIGTPRGRSRRKRGQKCDPLIIPGERSCRWMEGQKPQIRDHLRHEAEETPGSIIIANESVRVKGVVYPGGAEMPVSLWNPSFLGAALRAGTVKRRVS